MRFNQSIVSSESFELRNLACQNISPELKRRPADLVRGRLELNASELGDLGGNLDVESSLGVETLKSPSSVPVYI